jgi:hypothetical protein
LRPVLELLLTGSTNREIVVESLTDAELTDGGSIHGLPPGVAPRQLVAGITVFHFR